MRKMIDSGIKWIGEIPEAWSVTKVKYFYDCYDGKRIPVDSAERRSGPYPYWGAGSVTDYVDNYIFDEELVLLGEDGAPFFDHARPVAFLINEKVWVNNHIHVLKPKTNIEGRFLVHWFNIVDYKAYINGSILNKLTQSNMNSIALALPPLAEQVRIVDYLDAECAQIDAVIGQIRASIEEYKKLKQSVITRAVTKGIRPGRKMKDSGVEWIGEIPEEWKLLSLGAVTESMRNGYVGPTKDLFIDEGVKYIQSLHIKDGRIDFSRQQYYVSEEWANVHPKIKENDVLIVQTGDVGSVGLVTAEYDRCNCHALIIATPRTNLVFPQYLTFFLRSTVGKELLLFYKTGALLPHLNSGKIKFASICVPGLQEQKEIVNYLNAKCIAIDNLISKKELLASELESYKKSLIFEYVTGKKAVVI